MSVRTGNAIYPTQHTKVCNYIGKNLKRAIESILQPFHKLKFQLQTISSRQKTIFPPREPEHWSILDYLCCEGNNQISQAKTILFYLTRQQSLTETAVGGPLRWWRRLLTVQCSQKNGESSLSADINAAAAVEQGRLELISGRNTPELDCRSGEV